MLQSFRCLALCLALLANACGGGAGDTSQLPVQPISPALSQRGSPVQPAPPLHGSQVFALMDVGDSTTLLDGFAARATVDGLAFRTSWKLLEPQDGVYDWTVLDAAFDTVRARGKQLTLHVGASSIGLPTWLAAAGVAMYTYSAPMGGAVTDAVPWDVTLVSRYTRLVAVLAAHVRARGDAGLLYAVSDGAPVAEMSIPGCRNGVLTGGVSYSRARYLNAWKTTVDAHAAAFPGTPLFISAPVGVICAPDSDGPAFYTELMDHALSMSAQATAFAADLNAAGSTRLAQVDASLRARAAIAFQMIWSASDDTQDRMRGTLKDAVCNGLEARARYFEIYKADLSSPDGAIQDAVQRARAGQPC